MNILNPPAPKIPARTTQIPVPTNPPTLDHDKGPRIWLQIEWWEPGYRKKMSVEGILQQGEFIENRLIKRPIFQLLTHDSWPQRPSNSINYKSQDIPHIYSFHDTWHVSLSPGHLQVTNSSYYSLIGPLGVTLWWTMCLTLWCIHS